MRRFIGLAVLLVLVTYAAFSSGFSLYFRLAYLLVAALAIGVVWPLFNLRRLSAKVERRSFNAQVGDVVEGKITVDNLGPFPKPWLEVEELSTVPGHASGRIVSLKGKEERAWLVRTECTQRGLFTVGPLQVTSTDPLGLFRSTRKFSTKHSVVIYPATLPLPHLRLPLSQLAGEEALRHRAQQLPPLAASIRDYAPGDAVNRIHWRTTARTGKLMVKEFDLGLSLSLWILLDMEGAAQAGKGPDSTEEVGVTVAASVARKYLAMGLPVGLVAEGDESYLVRADSSPSQLQRLLETLAKARATGRTPVAGALERMERYLGRYSTLLVITPSPRSDWLGLLPGLTKRGARVALVVLDRASFGGNGVKPQPGAEPAGIAGLTTFTVRKGQPLAEALRSVAPVGGESGLRESGLEAVWR